MAFVEIQLAIDDSHDNDIVKVCPGTYHEELTIQDRPGLVLEGVKPWQATIKPPLSGTSTADVITNVISVHSDGAVVRWLKVVVPATGDCDFVRNGIVVDAAQSVAIRSNRLFGGAGDPTSCGLFYPIVFTNGASGVAGYNLLSHFVVAGVLVSNDSVVKVQRNSIRMYAPDLCAAVSEACASATTPAVITSQIGIAVDTGATATIRHNVIAQTPATGAADGATVGISVTDSILNATRNRIRGMSQGMFLNDASGAVRWNRVSHGGGTGISLQTTSGLTVAHNVVTQRGNDGMFVSSDSAGNSIHDNDFSGNSGTDCVDDSSGPANTWTNDFGNTSAPTGLCAPEV